MHSRIISQRSTRSLGQRLFACWFLIPLISSLILAHSSALAGRPVVDEKTHGISPPLRLVKGPSVVVKTSVQPFRGSPSMKEPTSTIYARVIRTFLHGRRLVNAGRPKQGLPFLKTSLAEAEQVLGPHHSLVINILIYVARAATSAGQIGEAEGAYERVLQVRTRTHGKYHPVVSGLRLELADLLEQRADYLGSEQLIRDELDFARKARGEGDPTVAKLLVHLAKLKKARGDVKEVESLFHEALRIWESQPAMQQNDSRLGVLLDLGDFYKDTGDCVTASGLYQKARKIQEHETFNFHPTIPLTLISLGDCQEQLGQTNQARQSYLAAQDFYEKTNQHSNPNLATVLSKLGLMAKKDGKLEQAKALIERSVDLQKVLTSQEDSEVWKNHLLLGTVALDKGRLDEAEGHFRQSLDLAEKSLERDSPRLFPILGGLARVQQERPDLKSAERLYQTLLARVTEVFEDDWEDLAQILRGFGRMLEGQERYEEAQGVYEALILQAETFLPSRPGDSGLLGNLLADLGRLLLYQDRPQKAEPLLKRSLRLTQHAYGKSERHVRESALELADALFRQDKVKEAEQLVKNMLGNDEILEGPAAGSLSKPLEKLEYIYAQGGNPDGASEVAERREIIQKLDRNHSGNHQEFSGQVQNLLSLAAILEKEQRWPEAESLVRQALDRQIREYGKEDPLLVPTYEHLGVLLWEQNKLAEGETEFFHALKLYTGQDSLNHVQVGGQWLRLALLAEGQGKNEEAELRYVRALKHFHQGKDMQRPEVRRIYYGLGLLNESQNRFPIAKRLLEKGLEFAERASTAPTLEMANFSIALGRVIHGLGDSVGAQDLFVRGVTIQQHFLGRKHPAIAEALYALGKAYVTLGQYAQAERTFRRARIIYQHADQTEGLPYVSVLRELQQVYYLRGNSAAAQSLEPEMASLTSSPSSPLTANHLMQN